ncbi:DUF416 family protein [Blastopirellula marina]|uniref:DUF416 domain-containing protein n=1 Tax=Blastopirellula marina TaxID=124 RepID=A0A2S8GQY4_9BACT|nr:DUF416 family protein [Blastopirellula marina]PQO46849.1 hypothetical protein C5Y93_06780 [Blastopirellula marina]
MYNSLEYAFELKRRLAGQPLPVLAAFSVACTDHAFRLVGPSFSNDEWISVEDIQLVQHALDLLWQAQTEKVDPNILAKGVEQIESLVPDDDSDSARAATEAVGGWVYFLTSLYSSLRCQLGQDPPYWAQQSAENAFNTLFQRELYRFMREQGRGYSDSDESEVMSNAPILAQEIGFQWQCLERCKQGLPIERPSFQ